MEASTSACTQKYSLEDDGVANESCNKRRRTIEEFFGKSAKAMPDGSCTQSTLHQYMELKGPAPQVNPVVLKGLKFFSACEIQEAEGLEKDYRLFWNFKLREICGDKKARSLSNKAIVGAVTTSWYLHKVDLMQLQVDELTSLLHAEYSPGEVELKTKSVKKNFERLVVSRQKIRGYYAAIESGKFLSERLKIEENITTEITELKKASEALKKAIDRRFVDIAKLRAKKQQETSMIVDSDLSLPEVEEIVEEVKVEDEQHNYTPLSDEETAVLDQAHELQSLEQSFKLVMSDDSESDIATDLLA